MSPKLQLAAVIHTPESIYYIDKPTELVQVTAVSSDQHNIMYIENPSIAAILAAK